MTTPLIEALSVYIGSIDKLTNRFNNPVSPSLQKGLEPPGKNKKNHTI